MINPYIAMTVKRVNAHMKVSKLKPRFDMGSVLAAMLPSKRIAEHDDQRKQDHNGIRHPFDIDRSAEVFDQFR